LRPDEFLLEARHLTTVLGGKGGVLRRPQRQTRAVDDVSIAVRRGESIGIVGESGCGKTTLGRTLLGVLRETSGEIHLDGTRVDGLPPRRARLARSAIQYLHQDAAGSLDPWWSVGRTIAESLIVRGARGPFDDRIDAMLQAVGLAVAVKGQYPHQLSGGQLRRVALARLMILAPQIVILDEPTSGLDLSVQAAVLNLLLDVKRAFNLTNLFISHDMAVVRLMCDRVAVMYRGRIVEQGRARELFRIQRHPYTRALLAATPRLGARRAAAAIAGDPPALARDIPGCGFHTRCPHAIDICKTRRPELEIIGPDTGVACHRWRELATDAAAGADPAVPPTMM
jgi:oligopeptide/dipeptide ABC transporter ATP-binding protein